MSDVIRVQGGRPLHGTALLGPDEHVLECALVLAALADGRSQLQGVQTCQQLTAATTAWAELGVSSELAGDVLTIDGVGLHGLSAPRGVLDAGSSMGLLAQLGAVLSAQAFGTRVLLRSRAFELAIEHSVGALRARGAHIAAHSAPSGALRPPIAVAPLVPPEQPQPIDATLPFADSAAKHALLLSGLFASGPTTVSEPHVSFDGLERLLVALGLPLRRIGSVIAFDPSGWDRRVPALGPIALPGSAQLAAYFAVLAQWLPGSDITLQNVSVNPSHNAIFDVLRSWGVGVGWQPSGDAALREPIADVRLVTTHTTRPRGGVIDAELLVRAGDAVPALALLGPVSSRGVRMCELGALAARTDPTLRALDALLTAFDVASTRANEELFIAPRSGPAPERTRTCNAAGDPALALVACTLALASPGETVVQEAAHALAAVYPGFLSAAQQLGASFEIA